MMAYGLHRKKDQPSTEEDMDSDSYEPVDLDVKRKWLPDRSGAGLTSQSNKRGL